MAHKRLAAHLRRVVAAVGRVAVRHREALRPIAGHVGLGPEEPLRVDVGGPQVGPPVDQDLVSLVALPRRLLPHVRTSVILHRLGGTPRLRRTITRLPHTNARSCICCCQSRNGTSTSIASARARGPGFGQQTTHPRWQLRAQGGSPPGLPGWAGGGSDVGGRGGGSVGAWSEAARRWGRGERRRGRERRRRAPAAPVRQATNKLEFERGEAGEEEEDPPHLVLPSSAARSRAGTWGKSDNIVGVRGCAGRPPSALRRSSTPPAGRSMAISSSPKRMPLRSIRRNKELVAG